MSDNLELDEDIYKEIARSLNQVIDDVNDLVCNGAPFNKVALTVVTIMFAKITAYQDAYKDIDAELMNDLIKRCYARLSEKANIDNTDLMMDQRLRNPLGNC